MNVLKNLVKGITLSSSAPKEENHSQREEDGDSIPYDAQPSHNTDDHDTQVDETTEDRKRLWTKVSGLIGKDTTSLLSLPVSLFEPISVLQSMCEPLRQAELIEKACTYDDPLDRICVVAAFCTALFSNYIRTVKPFNPVLGETFEFTPSNKNYKTLCEQVSHHPPIGLAHTISENWTLQQESRIETKFWGNSVDITGVGNNHLILHKRGDHFSWKNPISCCHNIIFGRMWIEHYGTVPIQNNTTGDYATITFKKAGWFEGINYDFTGEAHDSKGNLRGLISGKWNEFIQITRVDENGNKQPPNVVWRKVPDGETTNKWKWDRLLFELTALDEMLESTLPPTDSRLRADLRALAAGNMKLAAREKHRIEERERHKRREREKVGEKWSPVHFKRVPDEKFDYKWEFVSNYWEGREQKLKEYKEKRENHKVENKKEEEKENPTQSPPISPRSENGDAENSDNFHS
jgi:hypothetical protein